MEDFDYEKIVKIETRHGVTVYGYECEECNKKFKDVTKKELKDKVERHIEFQKKIKLNMWQQRQERRKANLKSLVKENIKTSLLSLFARQEFFDCPFCSEKIYTTHAIILGDVSMKIKDHLRKHYLKKKD